MRDCELQCGLRGTAAGPLSALAGAHCLRRRRRGRLPLCKDLGQRGLIEVAVGIWAALEDLALILHDDWIALSPLQRRPRPRVPQLFADRALHGSL